MQDRFRFRAWDKEQKIMVYNAQDTYDYPCVKACENSSFGDVLENEKYIVMQCTGLKDKSGNLIYESDIVFNNCGRWIIKYCDKCKSFQCFDETYGCYACEGDYHWSDFLEDLDRTTVEGNIYENKELLNG